MLLQDFDSVPLAFGLGNEILVVLDEELEEGSDDDVVRGGCVGVAVDREV